MLARHSGAAALHRQSLAARSSVTSLARAELGQLGLQLEPVNSLARAELGQLGLQLEPRQLLQLPAAKRLCPAGRPARP